MTPDTQTIEVARLEHLAQIVEIYNHTAASSIANFDTRPTTYEERLDWFAKFSATGPYRLLVALRGDVVLGYAQSARYRDHDAFQETVEVGVAVRADSRAQGIGTRLYEALFEHLATQPIHVVLAGIALPNDASVALHRKFGFTEVGTFREYAIKGGRYISSVWMQRLQAPRSHG